MAAMNRTQLRVIAYVLLSVVAPAFLSRVGCLAQTASLPNTGCAETDRLSHSFIDRPGTGWVMDPIDSSTGGTMNSKLPDGTKLEAQIDGFAKVTVVGSASVANAANAAIALWVSGQMVATTNCVDVDELRSVKSVTIERGSGPVAGPITITARTFPGANGKTVLVVRGEYPVGLTIGDDQKFHGANFSYLFVPGFKWIVETDVEIFGHRYTAGTYEMAPGGVLTPGKN